MLIAKFKAKEKATVEIIAKVQNNTIFPSFKPICIKMLSISPCMQYSSSEILPKKKVTGLLIVNNLKIEG